MKVYGEFQVKLQPMEFYVKGADGMNFGRISINKIFLGQRLVKVKCSAL